MKTKSATNRRKFLLAAGLGGAGAAVVAMGKAGKGAAPAQAAGAGEEASGYRDTEHIRKYYKTTQV